MDLEVAQGVLWSFVQITNRILGLSHGLCPIFNAVTDIGLSNSAASLTFILSEFKTCLTLNFLHINKNL